MRRVLPLVLLLAVLAAPTAEARGEWFDHYLDGVEALDRGEPERAIEMIGRALKTKPRGGTFRTYGNNYIRYAPYFHLGAAHHDLDDCAAALEALARAEADGEVDGEPALSARLRSMTGSCRTRLAAAEAPDDGAADPRPPAPPAEPPPRPIDAGLVTAGSDAYLAGEFDAAARAFEALARQAPDSATLRVLLAAALHGEAAAAEDAERLLERCRGELRHVLRLDPRVELDPRFFSPGLIALLENARRAAGPGQDGAARR